MATPSPLIQLLNKTTEQIESIVGAFYFKNFTRSQHFVLCLELCVLLQGNVLDAAQTVLAICILGEYSRVNTARIKPIRPSMLPNTSVNLHESVLFLSYFLDIMEQGFSDIAKRMVCFLIPAILPGAGTSQKIQLFQHTAADLAQHLASTPAQHFKLPDIVGIRKIINIEREAFGLIAHWMRPRAPEGVSSSKTSGLAIPSSSAASASSVESNANNPTPAIAAEDATATAATMMKLFMQAFITPLNPQQQQQLIAYIQANTDWLVSDSQLISQHLFELVEQNSNVAVECICAVLGGSSTSFPALCALDWSLVEGNSNDSKGSPSKSNGSAATQNKFTDGPANEYLVALLSMEISLKNIDAVNRIISAAKLPMEFIHLYISNCIASCENIANSYLQGRLVRVVCAFLTSLLRNKVIDVNDLNVEVRSFCIQFSRIKEANVLFRMLTHDKS